MKTFTLISKIDIDNSLQKTSRQYLVGNLKKPQEVLHIVDECIEVGITSYDKFTSEDAHKHSEAIEYQLMLSGYTEYYDLNADKIISFSEGDFYAIAAGTAYAQKSKAGTKILFIKVPSINDKEIVSVGAKIKEWLTVDFENKSTANTSITLNSDRQKHTIAVAELMRKKAQEKSWDSVKCDEMFTLGYLHDIGYALTANQSEHAKSGGETLEKSGYKYWREIYHHGLPRASYTSEELTLLNFCDMSIDDKGMLVSFEERLEGIKSRYGSESIQYKMALALLVEVSTALNQK